MNRKIRTELNRMVQIGLGRSNQNDQIARKEVEDLSDILNAMQEICQILTKKLKEGVPVYGGEKDVSEKRLKKIQEFMLAETMRDCTTRFGDLFPSDNVFCSLLNSTANVEELLAKEQISYEMYSEDQVVKPYQALEAGYKNIRTKKKELQKLCADMEAAKKKLANANRQSSVPSAENSAHAAKIAQAKDEFDEISKIVDRERDSFSTEVYAMTAREAELSDILLKHVQLKTEYHRQALRIFESFEQEMQEVHERVPRPVFGTPLSEELRHNKRRIASVLEFCAGYLYHYSLDEEGLLRQSGSGSRVKLLVAAFDAQLESLLEMLSSQADHHVVASTLKQYLRELPEPLTASALHNDWMEAAKVEDVDKRCEALKKVIKKLPTENHDNLSYLIRFLAEVAKHSDRNKMIPSNLAIVMSPNLFGNGDAEKTGFDMAATNMQHIIVETLIAHQKDFFPGGFEVASGPNSPWQKMGSSKDSSSYDVYCGPESLSASPRPTTPTETQPPSPKQQKSAPFKAKKAPAVPRRTEHLPHPPVAPKPGTVAPIVTAEPPSPVSKTEPPVTPVAVSKPVAESPPPASKAQPPLTPVTHQKVYPELRFADDTTPPISGTMFEPTVVPVAYSPSVPISTVPHSVPLSRDVPSPLPAARRRPTSERSERIPSSLKDVPQQSVPQQTTEAKSSTLEFAQGSQPGTAKTKEGSKSGLKDSQASLYPVLPEKPVPVPGSGISVSSTVSENVGRTNSDHAETKPGSQQASPTKGSASDDDTGTRKAPEATSHSRNKSADLGKSQSAVNGSDGAAEIVPFSGNGDSSLAASKPTRPPVPPKRLFSENTTYL